MTRKRFCKKLMALGVERNRAAMLADRVKPGQSFEQEFHNAVMVGVFSGYGLSIKRFARACRKFSNAMLAATGDVRELRFTIPVTATE